MVNLLIYGYLALIKFVFYITFIADAVQFKKKSTCHQTLCPLNSRCVELYPAACRCDVGFVHDVGTDTCSDVRLMRINDVHLDRTFYPSYMDHSSRDYMQLVQEVESSLMENVNRSVIQGMCFGILFLLI